MLRELPYAGLAEVQCVGPPVLSLAVGLELHWAGLMVYRGRLGSNRHLARGPIEYLAAAIRRTTARERGYTPVVVGPPIPAPI